MNYTLNQLQVFLKVCETRSITKAAEALHLTQPAVSIQLRNFQDQFDIPLTEVIGRKLYVTEFGKEIAAAADNILLQVQSINHKTLEYKGHLAGRLKLAVVSTGKYIMPYFLSDFMKLHQGIELIMDVANKAQVVKSLADNEVDFALVSVLPAGLETEKLELLQNRLFLVGNTDQKYSQASYSKQIFKELPLIYRESGSGTRQTMERFIERNHIPVLKKIELTSNEAVKQAVLAGLGYSIMPLIGIKNELQHGDLRIIPVKGLPIKTMWTLIWLRKKKHSPVASAFLDYMRKNRHQIVAERFWWHEDY